MLRDALDLPFAEIADVLGCTPDAARQHAARARRVVADADLPPRARTAEQEAVLAAFADAMARADVAALLAVLHPDVRFVSDGGGQVPAALRPVVGAEKVARLLVGLLARYGPATLDAEVVHVNGELGLALALPAGVLGPVVDGGRIRGLYSVVNPAKLRGPGMPRRTPDR